MARAPLIFGGNLTRLDALSRSLLTNRTLIAIDQNANESHPVDTARLGSDFRDARLWRAAVVEPGSHHSVDYFAFFSLTDGQVTLHATWAQLGINGVKHPVRDVWKDDANRESKQIDLTLPSHGSEVFEVH
jgi:hypothetical protein